MAEIDIGMGKAGRLAYELSEVAILPNRRVRDTSDIDLSWQIDAFAFDLPLIASAMDSVVSPSSARELGRLGAAAALHLEGLWTRWEDPAPLVEEITQLPEEKVHRRLGELYGEAVKPELIRRRAAELREAGVVVVGAVTPQSATRLLGDIRAAELDVLVIQGTVVSAEHVARTGETLNLKRFVRELESPVLVGGCASYQAALHLMRTGAAGILVGVGAGAASSSRAVLGLGSGQATALADARAARMRHLDETGVYVHLIADGGMDTSGDLAAAIACGADAVMMGSPLSAATDSPGHGWSWGVGAGHPRLPRGGRTRVGTRGTTEEILIGPAVGHDGATNLFGALRKTMALTGHATLKDLQKAELVVGARR
ncbi:MAG: GuaB3 family IMP dehydrogenase-related protein [Microthrixaceae bacterium]|nr:GuaB3 family IMP dehydrogenase-related protein [Microthrixaceae bacterium]